MKDKAAVTSVEIKIALAAKHHKDFFLTEVKSGPTQIARAGSLKILDGLAIRKSWTDPCFTGYEVKISRGDFLRDAKFFTYMELCNCLYIVCPKGMIDRAELPESIGLMYYDPDKKAITTRKKAIYRKIEYTPEMLLYIIFSRLESDRYPFFSSKQEYFEAYLAGKHDNRMLASAIRTKLVEENVRLEREVEKLERFSRQFEEYRIIKAVLDKHMIWGYGEEMGKRLDKALSSKCPDNITDICRQAERLAERLRAIEAKAKGDKQDGKD